MPAQHSSTEKFRILSGNGLTKMPSIRMTHEHRTVSDIDLSNNKIQLLQQEMLKNVRLSHGFLNFS